jgi:hypothetical protein
MTAEQSKRPPEPVPSVDPANGGRSVNRRRVRRGSRLVVRAYEAVIRQAGVRTIATPDVGGPADEWAVMFPASEARKLLNE